MISETADVESTAGVLMGTGSGGKLLTVEVGEVNGGVIPPASTKLAGD